MAFACPCGSEVAEEISFTCNSLAWTGLEVLWVWQGGKADKVGKVTFCATFMQEGKEAVHEETSRFKRHKRAWMYLDGEVVKREEKSSKIEHLNDT
jgi:SEC-C motif-containing protein